MEPLIYSWSVGSTDDNMTWNRCLLWGRDNLVGLGPYPMNQSLSPGRECWRIELNGRTPSWCLRTASCWGEKLPTLELGTELRGMKNERGGWVTNTSKLPTL